MIPWYPIAKFTVLALNWIIAVGWSWRVASALRNLPRVPDLLDPAFALSAPPSELNPVAEVCIIVPARNEAESIAATLRSLLASQGPPMEIIAVDDRSTDQTGAIMDAVAATASQPGIDSPSPLRVLHVTELPSGWLGKPHAMALAARQSTARWLLFTDGDVEFRQDALRRALRLAAIQQLDHLVLFPTLVMKTPGERLMISFFNATVIWGIRPWRVSDPAAKRDFIGIGAFSLIRRDVYRAVGGYESLRMEVLDDLRLGFLVKQGGYRQQVAFGRNLIRIRWAKGALGIVGNLTKNIFAVFRFRPLILLGASLGVAGITLIPFVGLFGGNGSRVASLLSFAAIFLIYRYYRRYTGISTWYALTLPLAATLSLYSMLRSMAVTLLEGGVTWRGTHYPLKELRKQAGPLR